MCERKPQLNSMVSFPAIPETIFSKPNFSQKNLVKKCWNLTKICTFPTRFFTPWNHIRRWYLAFWNAQDAFYPYIQVWNKCFPFFIHSLHPFYKEIPLGYMQFTWPCSQYYKLYYTRTMTLLGSGKLRIFWDENRKFFPWANGKKTLFSGKKWYLEIFY